MNFIILIIVFIYIIILASSYCQPILLNTENIKCLNTVKFKIMKTDQFCLPNDFPMADN